MKSVIHSSRIANKNPQDYEARSNIMWSATWALNTLVAKATEDMIPDLVKGTIVLPGGYKVLDADEIEQIFRESF